MKRFFLALSLATFVPLAPRGVSQSGLSGSASRCKGCSELPTGTDDTKAKLTLFESTLPQSTKACEIEVQLCALSYSETCTTLSGGCLDAQCKKSYDVRMRSLSIPGSSGCSGILVNFDETVGGQTMALTEDQDAGDYDGAQPNSWGPWQLVFQGELATDCGSSAGKTIDVTANLAAFPAGSVFVGPGADEQVSFDFKCAGCVSPYGAPWLFTGGGGPAGR